MSVALLQHIPGLRIVEPEAGVIIITAPDGFRLHIERNADVWRFKRGTIVSATHFHLRRLIADALNSPKVTP